MNAKPRHVPVALPPDLYSQLERLAHANDRDPLQQARWMLRQALIASPGEATPLIDADCEQSTPGLIVEVAGAASR